MQTNHEQQQNNDGNKILLRNTQTSQLVRGTILGSKYVAGGPGSTSSQGAQNVTAALSSTSQGIQHVRVALPSTSQSIQPVRVAPPNTSSQDGVRTVLQSNPSTKAEVQRSSVTPIYTPKSKANRVEVQTSCPSSNPENGGMKPRGYGTLIYATTSPSQATEPLEAKAHCSTAGPVKPTLTIPKVNQSNNCSAHVGLKSPKSINVTPTVAMAVSPSQTPRHPTAPMKRKSEDQATTVKSPNRVTSSSGQKGVKRMYDENAENMTRSCAICFEEFTTPKVLSCGHTFCLHCIKNIVDRRGPKPTLLCPTCRRNVNFPESGKAEDLPTNYQLVAIMSDKEPEVVVENADDNIEKLLRKCNVHRQVNKLYCQTCRVPVCVTCILHEHKLNKHELINEEDYVAKQTKGMEELANKLLLLEEKFQTIDKQVAANREAHIQEGQLLREKIQEKCTERKRQLDAERDALLRKVDRYVGDQNKKFEDMQHLVDTSQASLKEGKAEIRSTVQRVAAVGVSGKTDTNQIAENMKGLIDGLKASESVFASITPNLELKFVASNEGVGTVFLLKKS